MENNRKENLEELVNILAEIKSKVSDLEKRIEEYQKLLDTETVMDVGAVIELSRDDLLGDISDVPVEPVAEETVVEEKPFGPVVEQVAEKAGDLPLAGEAVPADDLPSEENMEFVADTAVTEETVVDLPVGEVSVAEDPGIHLIEEPVIEAPADDIPFGNDGMTDIPADDDRSLFGSFIAEEIPAVKTKYSRAKNLNDLNASRASGAVIDRQSAKPSWCNDIPGPEVKDVRSAISLNDRVMFISSLFREDSMLFQDVVAHVNAMSSLDKAVAYLTETFPEWNMHSDAVYRFMMAVRRKIR